MAGRVHLPQPQWWAAQAAPLARRGGWSRGRGPLCSPATAPFHDTRQAVAFELIEKFVNPLALVTARVEARHGGGGCLELAAALLCIELRLRLGGKLLRLRGRRGSRGITGYHWRSPEVTGGHGKVAGGVRDHGCAGGRASSESTVMAAHSTSEAQSFPDHTSAPFSTTTSLATPSAMSTAYDGGGEWEDGRQRRLTLSSGSVALLQCAQSCLGPSASA